MLRLGPTSALDTWDYVWTYSCWVQNGLTATPRVNLVTNIGFGPDATHTIDPNDGWSRRPIGSLLFPLKHPVLVVPHQRFDAFVENTLQGIGYQPLRMRVGHFIADVARGKISVLEAYHKIVMKGWGFFADG